jgi:hypothetical protein
MAADAKVAVAPTSGLTREMISDIKLLSTNAFFAWLASDEAKGLSKDAIKEAIRINTQEGICTIGNNDYVAVLSVRSPSSSSDLANS